MKKFTPKTMVITMIRSYRHGTLVALTLLAFPLAALTAAPIPSSPSDEQLKERALKLNELTSNDAMQARLTEFIKDPETAKRLVAVAASMQRKADPKEKPFKLNAAIVLAKVAHNVKAYDAAELFYDVAVQDATKLQSGSKLLLAYEGLLDLYWDQKKFKSVEDVCQKLMESRGEEVDKAKPFVLEKLVQAKAKQGDTDEALRMAEGLVNLDRGGWYFLQLKGWVQREAGKYDDAVETYTEVLERLDNAEGLKDELKTRLKRNVNYILSGLFVENKQIDKAANRLQQLMKDDPENPTYYNDLGFIWADHDMNLEKSEQLIRKALELDEKQRQKLLEEGKISAEDAKQENAAYLDSMGWVLFKQKKYKEAIPYLEKAAADRDEGAHIEIWDHLADAYMAVGEVQKAIDTWQKALKFEDISKRDAERRKKVTQKLMKAKAEMAPKNP
jgi:tetratricopeptide (TPR) repeat protein